MKEIFHNTYDKVGVEYILLKRFPKQIVDEAVNA